MLDGILGKEVIRQEVARKEPVPGIVTGLAWTPVGGEILFIEGTFMPGTGKLTLTGQLGDVMKESATISLSLIRSRLAAPRAGSTSSRAISTSTFLRGQLPRTVHRRVSRSSRRLPP